MNISQIIKSLREAIQVSPDNIPLKQQLATLLLQTKAHQEAEQLFKDILSTSPSHFDAKLGLAQASYHLKKHTTAIVILEQLLDEGYEEVDILKWYSRALLAEGSQAKAAEVLDQIKSINPDYIDRELEDKLKVKQLTDGSPAGDNFDGNGEFDGMIEKPKINFEQVGGMDKVKEEIDLKIIKPLQHPELYKAYGKKVGGGILLYGPPGCGKTHLARATAGQVDAAFMSVGINDVLDMYMGNSERKLHEIFEKARRNAPCVLFFDEIDALGASRTDMRKSAGRNLINLFLAELDGMEGSNEGLLILGATNAPWHLDPAFRRPGRFDRIIFVAPPDEVSRKHILEIILKDKPTEKVDLGSIAKKTNKFSGADLNAVVDLCIEEKLQASFKTGIPKPITTKDLVKAAKRHRPTTEEWFASARNYALYANDSGIYDEILTYLKIKK